MSRYPGSQSTTGHGCADRGGLRRVRWEAVCTSTAERPVVAAKRLFPYCRTLLSVICKVGCDGLALRELQRLSDRRRVPITRC